MRNLILSVFFRNMRFFDLFILNFKVDMLIDILFLFRIFINFVSKI